MRRLPAKERKLCPAKERWLCGIFGDFGFQVAGLVWFPREEDVWSVDLPAVCDVGWSPQFFGFTVGYWRHEPIVFTRMAASFLPTRALLVVVAVSGDSPVEVSVCLWCALVRGTVEFVVQLWYLVVVGVKVELGSAEVGCCCETSVVIIANILSDEPHLALELSKGMNFATTCPVDYKLFKIRSLTSLHHLVHADILFLQGLLDTFPFVTGDPQARNAIWSTLARLFLQIQENNISTSCLQQYICVLLEKAYLIGDDLKGHASDDSGEYLQVTSVSDAKVNATTISVSSLMLEFEGLLLIFKRVYHFLMLYSLSIWHVSWFLHDFQPSVL
ncbi:hypothetical protein Taro_026055 [Colocasia esculenta]|uniref:Uncharacterized protein n=1 Tax=Colocasia esculenta TaxID=4460 RepID=A0A843VME7_COLES|nr:hypothetical protein [Colocasia esculenta]